MPVGSLVVETVAVLVVVTVVVLVMPRKRISTRRPAGMVWSLSMAQTMLGGLGVGLKQEPTSRPVVVSMTRVLPSIPVNVVAAGKATVIWLAAAPSSLPLAESVKSIV